MNQLVCNYSLVRFLPYRETGEFVNIGVILYAPEFNLFDSKLAGKANRRVRAFFPEMDSRIYDAAVEGLQRELHRQKLNYMAVSSVEQGLATFRNLLRRRETLLHFAEPGMRLGEPGQLLDNLFAEYVERRFARLPDYQERVMQNRLGKWLKEWGIRQHYKSNRSVGDSMFNLTLPFVRTDGQKVIAAIKPLDLKRPDTTRIFDHGGLWVQRFRRLKGFNQLPTSMIVPVTMPIEHPHAAAAEKVVAELRETDVTVVPFEENRVRELAFL